MTREVTRTLSRESQATYDAIQRTVKTISGYGGRMNRDFVRAEQREIEDHIVVLEMFTEDKGYRRGFEEGVRRSLDRGTSIREQLDAAEVQLRTLRRRTSELEEEFLAQQAAEIPAATLSEALRAIWVDSDHAQDVLRAEMRKLTEDERDYLFNVLIGVATEAAAGNEPA
jgi:uncharacterized protein (DUF2267 family)